MLVAVILKRFCLKMQTQLTFSILISLLLQSYNGWRSTLPNRLLPNSLVMIGRKLDFILQQYTCAAYFQLKILRAFYSSPLQILSFYKKISGEHRCCCTSYSLNRFGFQNRETRKRLALSYFPQNWKKRPKYSKCLLEGVPPSYCRAFSESGALQGKAMGCF